MRKILWLAPALLLAGCHSEQVALKQQTTTSEPIAAAAVPLDSALTAKVVASWPALLVPAAAAPGVAMLPPARQAPPLRPARGVRPLSQLARKTIMAPATRRLAHRLQRQRPTEGVAESGLGGVVLFFVGLVLAVLAGLAALVSLIPGVSFWGGLGLAAAGLVVIFLVYSLFSGGKKKK